MAVGVRELEGETEGLRREWFGHIKPSGGNTFHANIASVFTFDSLFLSWLSLVHVYKGNLSFLHLLFYFL